jgi:hypothetical protein
LSFASICRFVATRQRNSQCAEMSPEGERNGRGQSGENHPAGERLS